MLKNCNILLVEDDEVDAEAIFRSLYRHKLFKSIVHVYNGLEALAVLRGENGSSFYAPYIILLDINMPKMNGIEFLQTVRQDQALKQSVIFVLTTSDLEQDKSAAYNECVAGYILKQRAGRDFLEAVKLLEQYQTVSELPPRVIL